MFDAHSLATHILTTNDSRHPITRCQLTDDDLTSLGFRARCQFDPVETMKKRFDEYIARTHVTHLLLDDYKRAKDAVRDVIAMDLQVFLAAHPEELSCAMACIEAFSRRSAT